MGYDKIDDPRKALYMGQAVKKIGPRSAATIAGSESLSAYIQREARVTQANAELLRAKSDIARLAYAPMKWSLVAFAVATFLVGPSILIILSVFTVFPWWVWAFGLLAIILYIMNVGGKR
jgi:hypothetical protein